MYYHEFCERLKDLIRKETSGDILINIYTDEPEGNIREEDGSKKKDPPAFDGILLCREDSLCVVLNDLRPETLYAFCEENGWAAFRNALMQSLSKTGFLKERPHTVDDYAAMLPPGSTSLFESLKEYRAACSSRLALPAYRIFTNRALFELCRCRPSDTQELLSVPGFGKQKAEQFGREILSLIREDSRLKDRDPS